MKKDYEILGDLYAKRSAKKMKRKFYKYALSKINPCFKDPSGGMCYCWQVKSCFEPFCDDCEMVQEKYRQWRAAAVAAGGALRSAIARGRAIEEGRI